MTKNSLDSGKEGSFTQDIRQTINNNFDDVSLCTTITTATTNTTLANITGLQTDTLASGTYRFNISLATTTGASGGLKIAFKQNNGLTLTAIEATAKGFTASAVAVQHTTTTTDQTSLLASTSLIIKAEIDGVFTVGIAGGNLTLQMAQNVSDGTATSVFINSRMEITRIGN